MIGCVPPSEFQHEKLKVIPFLNKNIPEEQEQFSQLLLNSHFLVFPTRADCSTIVIPNPLLKVNKKAKYN